MLDYQRVEALATKHFAQLPAQAVQIQDGCTIEEIRHEVGGSSLSKNPATRSRQFAQPAVDVKLTRFRGHLILTGEGVRYAHTEATVSGGVPPADGRAGSCRSHAGAAC